MATSISHSARIALLEAAQMRIEEEISQGSKLSSQPMAKALSVNWATLRSWCDFQEFSGSGAFVRGGNGIEWEFDAHKTVGVLLDHFRNIIAKEAKRNAPSLEAQGLDAGTTSIVEAERLLRLSDAVEASRLRQKETIHTNVVVWAIEEAARFGQEEFANFVTNLDPTGQIDAALRSRIEKQAEDAQWRWASKTEKLTERMLANSDAGSGKARM